MRAEKKKPVTNQLATDDEQEKAELTGGPYDPKIAGPVKCKPELETTTTNASTTGISELAAPRPINANSHELSTDDLTAVMSHELSSNKTPTPAGSSSGSGSAGVLSRKIPQQQPGNTKFSRLGRSGGPVQQPMQSDDELTDEADTLVSELGVISKRKKALVAAAGTAGVKPKEAEGRRGEEYRELVQREERVRKRMAEVQAALGTDGGGRTL